VFWILLGVFLLLVLLVLALTLLTLWRRLRTLGRSVAAAGETVGALSGTLEEQRSAGPIGRAGPCPTCGAPRPLLGAGSRAVRAPAR